jgi:hypothetical protein
MTHEVSRNGKSQQSGSVRKERLSNSALLAAVSILSASLGVTAAQSAVEVAAADGSSTHPFITRLAETKTTVHPNEVKTMPPVSQKPPNKGIHIEKRPIDFSTPSPSGPKEKPKRDSF